jgi:MFS family permease
MRIRVLRVALNAVALGIAVIGLVAGYLLSTIPIYGAGLGAVVAVAALLIALLIYIVSKRILNAIIESGVRGSELMGIVMPMIMILGAFASILLSASHAQSVFQCTTETIATIKNVLAFTNLLGIVAFLVLVFIAIASILFGGAFEILRGLFFMQHIGVIMAPFIFWILFLANIDQAIDIRTTTTTVDGTQIQYCQVQIQGDRGPIMFRVIHALFSAIGWWPR